MSDAVTLPNRGATAYQWLRVDGLLPPTVEPIVDAYADGTLMTRAEFIDSLDMGEMRLHMAWLMWCYSEGYKNPDDRAILTNWMTDLSQENERDRIDAEHLLQMADEIFAAVLGEEIV